MDDDLDLSMVDLDDLEKSAKSQLAERQRSSFATSVPHPGHSNNTWQNHDRPTSFSSPVKQVFPPSPSKSLGRTSTHPVKFFYDQAGRIGLKTMYNKHLVAGLKMVPGHEWDANRKIWTYPENRYQEVVSRISTLPDIALGIALKLGRKVDIIRQSHTLSLEAVPPLVLPTCDMQEMRCTPGSNSSQQDSPLKLSQPLDLDHQIPTNQTIPLSPRQVNVCTGSPQTSPLKVRGTTIPVQIYLMDADHIAARSVYNEKVKEACQSVVGRIWNAEERVWMFTPSKLEELVQILENIPSPKITVQVIPPLKVSLSSTSTVTDELRPSQPDRELIPKSPHPTLLPVNIPTYSVKLSLLGSGDIAAKFGYNEKLVSALRTVPKASWNPKERLWQFPCSSLVEAEKALSNISDLIVNVEGLEPLVRRAIEASASTPDLQGPHFLRSSSMLPSYLLSIVDMIRVQVGDTALLYVGLYSEMPGQLESQLLPFQREGIRFALQRGARVLIADEMGLGKTLQAIAVVSCLENEWPVLILVPSSLRLQWAASLTQWLHVRPIDITVVMSQCSGSNREGFNLVHSAGKHPVRLDGLFNIVSYDLVTKLSQAISEVQFKIIIADEAHYLKNAQAKRTNACVPLLQKAKYALLLTGTPALSRPIELFKQLEALQPLVYKSVHEYGNRYCLGMDGMQGKFGLYQGCSNLQELHTLVKATVMFRRLKKDVLSELPQKRRQQVFVPLDDKGIKQMRALFSELEGIKKAMKNCLPDDLEKLKYADKQLLNKIYTESAVVKSPAVQDYLTTILEAECKFLVFAHHKSMLDKIEELLMKKKVGHIRIDGNTPQSARQTLVTRFQENDNVRAAVLGIRAAGVGLTLTAASTVIFAEMSWTPGDLVQAEDRAHRIGQASSVNVYYLHAHDTIDDILWDTVQYKLENLGQVLNGREDALHVDATPRHAISPKGQSKLDSYLQHCSAQPMMRNEDMAPDSDGPPAGPGMSVSVDSEEGGWQTGNSENRQFEASGQRAKRTKLF